MNLKTCEYCGTDYDASLKECPLCGKSSAGKAAAAGGAHTASRQAKRTSGKKGGRYVSKTNPYAIPKWMMAVICILLALAVILAALFALYKLGIFDIESRFGQKETDPSAEKQQEQQEQQETPHTPTEQDYTNEEDYNKDKPEEQPQQKVVPCSGISISTSSVTFDAADKYYNFTVICEPADCTEPVIYSSSDESVVSVNQQGKIMAIRPGSAIITVACGSQSTTCLVTCDFTADEKPSEETQPTEPLELNNTDMTFFHPGEQFQLAVKNAPEKAEITYSSSDPSIASVTDGGLVTAVSTGTATITVSCADQSMVSIVRCNLGSTAESGSTEATCTISHSDVTLGFSGERFDLTLKDAGGKKVTGLRWVSSNTAVCTVGDSGTVTAVGKGTAFVSVVYEGNTYSCIVRCSF